MQYNEEFVVGYSKVPEQPQSSARPICHSYTMTSTGCNQPPYTLLPIGACRTTHCATGDDNIMFFSKVISDDICNMIVFFFRAMGIGFLLLCLIQVCTAMEHL